MPLRSRNQLLVSHRPLAQIFFLVTPLCLFLGVLAISTQTIAADPPRTPVLGEAVVPPVYVPLIMTGETAPITPSIRGQLMLGDLPFPDADVTVSDCTTAHAAFAVLATSDAAGAFSVPVNLDDIQNGTPMSLTLAFSTSTPITHSLSPTESVAALGSYRSACLPAGSWPQLALPTLDLQAPIFVSPTVGEVADMPILFTWVGRANPRAEEILLWLGSVHFDCGNCASLEITATEQISTSTALEWCSVTPYSQTITDVTWVDYTLQVVNNLGTGGTLPRRTLVGTTLHECPPLP